VFSITTCVCIVWKCWCPVKFSSYGSICGRYISVDAPSIAPIALSGLVHELPLSLHSFIVVHYTICYNALFMIGMHLFISLWTVATLHILLVMIRNAPLPPDPFQNMHHTISNGQIESWDGCSVFSNFSSHEYSFYLTTKKPMETCSAWLELLDTCF
jgi:hypothetical protein